MILGGRAGSVVLMYHGIDRPARHGEVHYTVERERFARQLDLLQGTGRVVSFEALLSGRAAAGSVALTFDDGERSVVQLALPLMQARGLTGALFMTSDWIGSEGYLSADELRALQGQGWTVGAHGATHRYLSDLSDPALSEELARSRDALVGVLDRDASPLHMSLPGGRADHRVVEAVKRAGFGSLSTSEVGRNAAQPDRFSVRRTMVLGGWGLRTLQRAAAGDPRFYLPLRGRQALLGAAKRALGNRTYDRLRGLAFELRERAGRR
jgi:peptidoglycan/xylan/chitin deacetylase (PgdA/CDA1 family)